MLFAAVGYIVVSLHFHPLALVLAFIAYKVWRGSGGFDTWRPERMREFLHNARRIGL